MQNESRQNQRSKAMRGLSKTSSGLKRSRGTMDTLFYTSSTSSTAPLVNGNLGYAGLYRCALDDHNEKSLHNLQFYDGNKVDGGTHTNAHPSYVYANSIVDNKTEHPGAHVGSWEISRAKLPIDTSGLKFESVFRTLEVFDWNECDFKCCPYDPTADYNPFHVSEEEENNYFSLTHAYVRTVPRSFSVDETTGDIFISWEGFYKSCDPTNPDEEGILQWTIGVSRLKIEDPYCITNQANIMHNNFSRCTEPVAIAHQSSSGRDIVLPYGGFTVIPARANTDRRSFLLSALTNPQNGGDHRNMVWSVHEGQNRDHHAMSLNGEGTSLDYAFLNVWDGGTFRLHYNTKTGRPDHLCRSIFQKGIGCMPISETANGDILPQREEKIILTEEAFGAFCDVENNNSSFGERIKSEAPFVAGLEIVWDENDQNGTGKPKQAIFGCHQGTGNSKGSFGMIDINIGGASAPIQVIAGAYPGSVLFPPKDLGLPSSQFPPSDFSTNTTPSSFYQHLSAMIIVSILLCFLYVVLLSKSRSLRSNRRRRESQKRQESVQRRSKMIGMELSIGGRREDIGDLPTYQQKTRAGLPDKTILKIIEGVRC